MNFMIWSGSHRAWWKEDGLGYTVDKAKAGKFSIEDLENQMLDGLDPDDATPAEADVLVRIW